MGKIRGFMYAPILVISIVIIVVLMILFKNYRLNIRRSWAKFQRFCIGYDYEINGQFDTSAQIIVINHKSMLDIMVLEELHPKNLAWVAKEEIGKIPILGLILKLPNMIPIKRDDPRAIVKLISDVKDRLKDDRVIAIFPEGTRGRGDKILKFNPGAKVIAQKLNLKVQPIVLFDTIKNLDSSNMIVSDKKVIVSCLECVDTSDENWFEKLRENMQVVYNKQLNTMQKSEEL